MFVLPARPIVRITEKFTEGKNSGVLRADAGRVWGDERRKLSRSIYIILKIICFLKLSDRASLVTLLN